MMRLNESARMMVLWVGPLISIGSAPVYARNEDWLEATPPLPLRSRGFLLPGDCNPHIEHGLADVKNEP